MDSFKACIERVKDASHNVDYQSDDCRRATYDQHISRMRKREYPMLRGVSDFILVLSRGLQLAGLTYFDHGGTTLASRSLLISFCSEMQRTLLANPHSDTSDPSTTAMMVESTRLEVLKMFKADPAYFDIVFTANATAAIKLVAEGFSGYQGSFDYLYHRNSHTSLVGVRELAHSSRCLSSNAEVADWFASVNEGFLVEGYPERPLLFAYPAQSNMNGERLPLDWARRLRVSTNHPKAYTLLDAAALVSTTPLDLSNHLFAPDFISLSFYKIFGFPDLGALIIRKDAGHVFDYRRYFGGGTTEMTTCIGDAWVARKDSSLHSRLEDGTIAFRSILALKIAIATHQKLFGGLDEVSKHTSWLAKSLYNDLSSSEYANGSPVYHIYKSVDSSYGNSDTQGATVAFNVRKVDGSYFGPWHVGAFLRNKTIHVRTGTVCNPAGISCALGLDAEWLRDAFEKGYRCNTELDIVDGIPVGVVRITFGAVNTYEDVEKLVSVLSQYVLQEQDNLKVTDDTDTWKKGSFMAYRENKPSIEGQRALSEEADSLGTIRRRWRGLRRLFGLCFSKDP